MTHDNKADGVKANFEPIADIYPQGSLTEAPTNPNMGESYDLDPAIEPNKFPREGGSDSYTGIPGDGVVPG